jgi:hypothetical protein
VSNPDLMGVTPPCPSAEVLQGGMQMLAQCIAEVLKDIQEPDAQRLDPRVITLTVRYEPHASGPYTWQATVEADVTGLADEGAVN